MNFNFSTAGAAAKGFGTATEPFLSQMFKGAQTDRDKKKRRADIAAALGNVYNLPPEKLAGIAAMYTEGVPVPESLLDATMSGAWMEDSINQMAPNVQKYVRALPPDLKKKAIWEFAKDTTGRLMNQASNEVARVESTAGWVNLAPTLPRNNDGKVDWNKATPEQYGKAVALVTAMFPGNTEQDQRGRNQIMYGQPEDPAKTGRAPLVLGGMTAAELNMMKELGRFQGTLSDLIQQRPDIYAFYMDMPGTKKDEEHWASIHAKEYMDPDKAAVAANQTIAAAIRLNTGFDAAYALQKYDRGDFTGEKATEKDAKVVEVLNKYYVNIDGEWKVRQSVFFDTMEKVQRVTQFYSLKAGLKGYPKQFGGDLLVLLQVGGGVWDATFEQQLREKGYDETAIASMKLCFGGITSGDITEVMKQIEAMPTPAPDSLSSVRGVGAEPEMKLKP